MILLLCTLQGGEEWQTAGTRVLTWYARITGSINGQVLGQLGLKSKPKPRFIGFLATSDFILVLFCNSSPLRLPALPLLHPSDNNIRCSLSKRARCIGNLHRCQSPN